MHTRVHTCIAPACVSAKHTRLRMIWFHLDSILHFEDLMDM